MDDGLERADLVAVYGTLREGGGNHVTMTHASGGKLLGKFWTTPDWTMYTLGGYPALTEGGSDSVLLEIYRVKSLKALDQLEGYPGYYDRKVIETPWGGAWLYIMDEDAIPLNTYPVDSGDWIKYRSN